VVNRHLHVYTVLLRPSVALSLTRPWTLTGSYSPSKVPTAGRHAHGRLNPPVASSRARTDTPQLDPSTELSVRSASHIRGNVDADIGGPPTLVILAWLDIEDLPTLVTEKPATNCLSFPPSSAHRFHFGRTEGFPGLRFYYQGLADRFQGSHTRDAPEAPPPSSR